VLRQRDLATGQDVRGGANTRHACGLTAPACNLRVAKSSGENAEQATGDYASGGHSPLVLRDVSRLATHETTASSAQPYAGPTRSERIRSKV
jgi:hypothetical protein